MNSSRCSSRYNFVLTLIQGDILNSDLVSTVLKKFRVGWVIHFAAQTHVGMEATACLV